MIRLAPSILSADFSRLGEQVQTIERAGAHVIHVDVMDGHFVPNITFGAGVMKSLLGKTKLPFDVHLMIENPDQYLEDFATDDTEFITVHAEACTHLHRTIQHIKSMGIKAGVSLNPATPLDVLEYILEDLDLVLIMSVNPGFGGQKFIPSALHKIRELKKMKNERNPNLIIEIDGGITLDNIKEVTDAGVELVVAGSSVFGADDIEKRVGEFLNIFK
ncbi:ribulose-phosphate 3-epimerase [Sinanaerobacter chloroacetimidivorans]|jgi:ribulose-phosphate 3-epimerase|uniref:Ribulose-phosphate 3-epimerase n=1 Tax=Sinanaerobacter chloroacetimidivorans TaxID=2818044 RepID=A0A8J7W4J7_9FIRM|nr:ribulose-phosphate 3-epimerase [Sinanaerobacter chloroacetimidivorans]MBR0600216.1 ribulose-phosphate 3-epimerase [Sinanaerobacter chloroacetimidivorans]